MLLVTQMLRVVQLSYRFWRFCVRLFWWVVILYSMVVLTWIYVFQFENILAKWQNATGMTDSQYVTFLIVCCTLCRASESTELWHYINFIIIIIIINLLNFHSAYVGTNCILI